MSNQSPYLKLRLKKQAAGQDKTSTAKNAQELKEQLLNSNFKTTYRKIEGNYSTQNSKEFNIKEF